MVMSAERRLRTFLCSLALCASSLLLAAEAEAPDTEFLEYLGMWEESDEDWLLLDETVMAENEERKDPVLDGEESTENEDES